MIEFLKNKGIIKREFILYKIDLNSYLQSGINQESVDSMIISIKYEESGTCSIIKDKSKIKDNNMNIKAFINNSEIGGLWVGGGLNYISNMNKLIDFDGFYIYRLLINDHFRNQGCAKALLHHSLVKLATEKPYSIKNVYALVDKDNIPSQKAFAGVGFCEVTTIQCRGHIIKGPYEEMKISNP